MSYPGVRQKNQIIGRARRERVSTGLLRRRCFDRAASTQPLCGFTTLRKTVYEMTIALALLISLAGILFKLGTLRWCGLSML